MSTGDPIARAFELAKNGTCRNIGEIRRKLEAEGYSGVAAHTSGSSLKKQLAAIMKATVK